MRWKMNWRKKLCRWISEKPEWWFAWRPVKLDDTGEWVWLERVDRRIELITWEPFGFFDLGFTTRVWYYEWKK